MKFLSVCSGIEAASVAWEPLGWKAVGFSEIEPFPSAVLAHHYPDVPNYGDMTALPSRILAGEVEAPDLFCGGTPCQAFSVAGLRKSLDDARGNLSLTFCEIANAIDLVRLGDGDEPCIVFWENVPGVLSTKDNAFGCFLAGLAGEDEPLQPAGGKWTDAGVVLGPERAVAWRVLDAQYFGLAQRRKRVFVVASARDGFDPAQVLLEWDGVRRDSAPSREAGKVAPTIPSRSTAGGGLGTDFDCDGGVVQVCPTLRAGGNRTGGDRPPGTDVDTADSLQVVTHSLRGEGFDASEDGSGRETPLVPVTFRADAMREGTAKTPSPDAEGRVRLRDPGMGMYTDIAPTLDCGAAHGVAQPVAHVDTMPTMLNGANTAAVATIYQDSEFGVQQYDSAGTLRAGRIPEHQMVLQPAIAWDEELNASVEQAGTLLRGGQGGRHDGVAVPVAFPANLYGTQCASSENLAPAMGAKNPTAVAQPVTYDFFNITAPVNRQNRKPGDPCHTLARSNAEHAVLAFHPTQDQISSTEVCHSIGANDNATAAVAFQQTADCLTAAYGTKWNGNASADNGSLFAAQAMQVRRLTPLECERLQGFPDDYTAIPWRKKPASECPDGPRYKALGNSWAVPVVRWIGHRIQYEMWGLL